jgi:hypothetical protein
VWEVSCPKVIGYKYLINAFGQQALKIAKEYGLVKKGIYTMSDMPLDYICKTLVLLQQASFQGVHFTITVDGY